MEQPKNNQSDESQEEVQAAAHDMSQLDPVKPQPLQQLSVAELAAQKAKWRKKDAVAIVGASVGFFVFFVVVVVLAIALSPDYYYYGEHDDLYSVALHSVAGTRGYIEDESGKKTDPVIVVLEEDAYGREMFLYYEKGGATLNEYGERYDLVIMQRYQNRSVWFYSDRNYISTDGTGKPLHEENGAMIADAYDLFTQEQIDALKAQNDWGQNFVERNCVKRSMLNSRQEPVRNRVLNDVMKQAFGDKALDGYRGARHVTSDDYDRNLFVAQDRDGAMIAFVLQPDNSYDAATFKTPIADLYNCQSEIAAIKLACDWDKSTSLVAK